MIPPRPGSASFTAGDLDRLRAAGITRENAERQWQRLKKGLMPVNLLRPCILGDGIEALPETSWEDLSEEFLQACAEGRILHFIPASGAATRMGLSGPKALVPFHRLGRRMATPVEEHLREAAALADARGMARAHFTVAPEHEKNFRVHLENVLALLRSEGLRVEATHSLQDAATQTLALDEAGNLFRDASGALRLRPGGHGALLRNLEACGAEFAWIRNIDNIAVEPRRAEGRLLRRALAGKLVRLAREKRGRPLRVCAMVKNTGEPGGSPFWVKGRNQETAIRIVEASEVAAEQAGIFRSATHFNPVDMICALRDSRGGPYRLEEFSDPEARNIASKTHEGRPLRALEWPGLWNGGMARWDTVCAEIPVSQFAPVKSPEDLLRPEHSSPLAPLHP